MNLVEVMKRFSDQHECIRFLEKLRWNGFAKCPHCDTHRVRRRRESSLGRIGRFNCKECAVSFKVTHGTLFHGTKIGLRDWFLAICLVLNAKKSISSHQLSRDLDLNQKTAWYILVRIRAEMLKRSDFILSGVVEVDEVYIGGRPRKRNKFKEEGNIKPSKRGRGTSKTPVLGAVERESGLVIAQVAENLTGRYILDFIKSAVDMEDSELITDEFQAYNLVGKEIKRSIINHQEQYVDETGHIHTNTIEGFWSLVKRAWYGTHHHYSKTYIALYVAEACYKYNYRETDNSFHKFLEDAMHFENGDDDDF